MKRYTYILSWLLSVLFVVVVITLLLVFIDSPTHPVVSTLSQPKQPCSDDRYPCIALKDMAGNTIAEFNDFRFNGRCIDYVQPINRLVVTYCQPYHLEWIGPNTQQRIAL